MMEWDLAKTEIEILRLYGKRQWKLASPSLQSSDVRLQYIRIHYHAACDLLDKFVGANFQDGKNVLLDAISRSDEDRFTEFQDLIFKIGAQVTACVQSFHALIDTLAYAIYYSLYLNKTNFLKEREITLCKVISILKRDPSLNNIAELLKKLRNGGHFPQIDALANHGKHRSLVKSFINEDQTGLGADCYTIKFDAFMYDKVKYPTVGIKELLEPEYNRCFPLVIEIGNELNKILCARVPIQSLRRC